MISHVRGFTRLLEYAIMVRLSVGTIGDGLNLCALKRVESYFSHTYNEAFVVLLAVKEDMMMTIRKLCCKTIALPRL